MRPGHSLKQKQKDLRWKMSNAVTGSCFIFDQRGLVWEFDLSFFDLLSFAANNHQSRRICDMWLQIWTGNAPLIVCQTCSMSDNGFDWPDMGQFWRKSVWIRGWVGPIHQRNEPWAHLSGCRATYLSTMPTSDYMISAWKYPDWEDVGFHVGSEMISEHRARQSTVSSRVVCHNRWQPTRI